MIVRDHALKFSQQVLFELCAERKRHLFFPPSYGDFYNAVFPKLTVSSPSLQINNICCLKVEALRLKYTHPFTLNAFFKLHGVLLVNIREKVKNSKKFGMCVLCCEQHF